MFTSVNSFILHCLVYSLANTLATLVCYMSCRGYSSGFYAQLQLCCVFGYKFYTVSSYYQTTQCPVHFVYSEWYSHNSIYGRGQLTCCYLIKSWSATDGVFVLLIKPVYTCRIILVVRCSRTMVRALDVWPVWSWFESTCNRLECWQIYSLCIAPVHTWMNTWL